MDFEKIKVQWAGMLHDVGKVALRAGVGERKQNHALLGAEELHRIFDEDPRLKAISEAVRYHHARALSSSGLENDHIAYIICEADNIAAGTDRRELPSEEYSDNPFQKFRATKSLESVYNLVRTTRCDRDTKAYFPLQSLDGDEIRYAPPVCDDVEAKQSDYFKIWDGFQHGLKMIDWTDSMYLNSVHNLLAAYFSRVPSSTATDQVADISLFDHSSLTAALAACMFDWAIDNNALDFKKTFFADVGAFREEDAFLLVHSDLSGIQDFIYTISSKGALKSLRARSFYLEIMLEHIADNILSALELSRSNMIYSGGGGFYLVLPNTAKAIRVLEETTCSVNDWLYQNFALKLYFAMGWAPAKAKSFMDPQKTGSEGTEHIFRAVSSQVSKQKLQRYRGDSFRDIFVPQKPEDGMRECSTCGCSKKLSIMRMEQDNMDQEVFLCESCKGLMDMGRSLAISAQRSSSSNDVFCVEAQRPRDKGQFILTLPSLNGEAWITIRSEEQVKNMKMREELKITRIYSKNKRSTGLSVSTHLFIGDYCYSDQCKPGEPVEMSHFARNSAKNVNTIGDWRADRNEGIARIAVLRADVDSLGNLFALGFRNGAPDRQRYETLGRYATLSRSLSNFFQNIINHVAAVKQRNMMIVYSGGDDIFAVGEWTDILGFAVDLREAFREYTSDKLSFSAGIGFFSPGYPISRMASVTAQLEAMAKQNEKDSIALFGVQNGGVASLSQHVFSWITFQNEVLSKEQFLIRHLKLDNPEKAVLGKSFLYIIYRLLIEAENEDVISPKNIKGRISLARLAYTIARHDPGASASSEAMASYQELRKELYAWSLSKKKRQELITAIILCVYRTRERSQSYEQ